MSSQEEDEYWNLQVKIINCGYYVYCCTLVVGLLGNITAITVILCSKSFRNLTGFYLLSLSAADLLTLLTAVSFYIFARKIEFLSQGKIARYVVEWAGETSVIASTWTVTAFTVERYLAICHPFLVQSLSRRSRAKQIILGIWSISALLALLPTALVVLANQGDELQMKMMEIASPYVADVWSALCFFVPIAAIVAMYALIWVRLRNGEKQIARQQNSRADTRMLMMFVVIVASFLFSWGPYYIYRVLYAHWVLLKYARDAEHSDEFDALIDNFYLANLVKQIIFPLPTALNPIIFSLMSRKFRDALKDLVSNSSRKVFNWSLRVVGSRSNSNTVETKA